MDRAQIFQLARKDFNPEDPAVPAMERPAWIL